MYQICSHLWLGVQDRIATKLHKELFLHFPFHFQVEEVMVATITQAGFQKGPKQLCSASS